MNQTYDKNPGSDNCHTHLRQKAPGNSSNPMENTFYKVNTIDIQAGDEPALSGTRVIQTKRR